MRLPSIGTNLSWECSQGLRAEYANDIALRTDSTLVRIIGNVAIFYKENEDSSKRKIKLKQAAK